MIKELLDNEKDEDNKKANEEFLTNIKETIIPELKKKSEQFKHVAKDLLEL